MRRPLPCVAHCSLLPFCVGCCSVLPLCVAWSSALAARLVASRWSSAAAPLPAAALSRRPCQQRPAQWRPQASSSLATMAPLPAAALSRCPQPAASSRWLFAAAPLPASPPQRPCQQQTSFGGEEYSGLASNLAHLGRIC